MSEAEDVARAAALLLRMDEQLDTITVSKFLPPGMFISEEFAPSRYSTALLPGVCVTIRFLNTQVQNTRVEVTAVKEGHKYSLFHGVDFEISHTQRFLEYVNAVRNGSIRPV